MNEEAEKLPGEETEAPKEAEAPKETEAPEEKIGFWKRWKPKHRSPRVTWMLTIGLLFGAAVGMCLLLLLIVTTLLPRACFLSFLKEPDVFALNLAPTLILIVILYALTNRAWISFLLPSVTLFVMSFINHFKVILRSEPFVAADMILAGEAAGIVGEYELAFPKTFYLGILAIVFGTIILLRYAKGRVPKKLWWTRLVAVAMSLGLGAVLWTQCYTDDDLYYRHSHQYYDIFNTWNAGERYAAAGFPYSFVYSVHQMLPTPPDGYSEEAAEALLNRYEEADIPEEKKINLLVTMMESYSDLSELIELEGDPYAELHALQEECYSGTLIPDCVGGNTIQTERSFLTGYYGIHPSYQRNTESFAWYLKDQGYVTDGAHPGNDWFYSRNTVNLRLGMDNYVFNQNHFDPVYNQTFVKDEVLFPDRIQAFEERDPSKPYFSFTVSYQNHSPYKASKLVGKEYFNDDRLSEDNYYRFNNYIDGTADTSRRIAEYVDYFRDVSEPVVLVIFGDHKPVIGTGNVGFDEMEIKNVYDRYSTPYLIWANDAAKEALGKDFVGEGPTISPAYLMSVVFDACGWTGNQFIQCQRELREVLPVKHYMDLYLNPAEDGVLIQELSEEGKKALNEAMILQYYLQNKIMKD